MKAKNNSISIEANQIQFSTTEKILQNVEFLQASYGSLSGLHGLYLDTIKDIQIHLIEQLKNKQFEDSTYVANMTANFVREIIHQYLGK